MRLHITLAAAAAAFLTLTSAATARPLQVDVDQSTRISLPTAARDVVIGNPSIADVSVLDGHTIMVLGKSFGVTSLMITDVHMPVLGGLDVFQGLRAAHWTTPVIVVTGHDTPALRAAVARLGAVLLLKPLDLDILERTVRELLAKSARKPNPRPAQKPH